MTDAFEVGFANSGIFTKPRIDPRCVMYFVSRMGNGQADIRRVIVNPTSFKESTQTHYSSRQVIGLSHEVAQYVRTGSRKISMELWFSYHILFMRANADPTKQNNIPDPRTLLQWRNWFEAHLVPSSLGKAPRLLSMEWPRAELHFTGVLESLNTEYERFTYNGTPMEMKMEISLLEVPSGIMLGNSVQRNGLGYY